MDEYLLLVGSCDVTRSSLAPLVMPAPHVIKSHRLVIYVSMKVAPFFFSDVITKFNF
jgi:hypothetical protein